MDIQNLKNRMHKHWAVLLYLCAYVGIFAHKLITKPAPFFDWDESIYAQVGREMVHRASLVPSWQYETWLDKPPFVPLFYGTLMKMTPFIMPEISTRIATLIIASIALLFVYILYYRATKNTLFATAVVILTSCTSIILQRALVLNIDIFLLIGWLGYVVFYDKRSIALGFLAVAVLSKSLIGFYAPGIMFGYFCYQYLTKKCKPKEFIREIKYIATHVSILLLWYIVMYAIYGNDFFIQHVYESHTKRVTASIESHFGQRTFYITLLTEYFGRYTWLAIPGLVLLGYQYFKKQISDKALLYSLFLLPWFIFLNGTKTKIFWYSHPYIPQFAFLILYPLTVFTKVHKYLFVVVTSCVIAGMLWTYYGKYEITKSAFATREPHHDLAEYAKSRCNNLVMLMNPTEREKIATLRSMDLTITTTTWWGEHPSMVYYFEKPIHFVYTLDEFGARIKDTKNMCFTFSEQDKDMAKKYTHLEADKQFGTVYLYKTKVK